MIKNRKKSIFSPSLKSTNHRKLALALLLKVDFRIYLKKYCFKKKTIKTMSRTLKVVLIFVIRRLIPLKWGHAPKNSSQFLQ